MKARKKVQGMKNFLHKLYNIRVHIIFTSKRILCSLRLPNASSYYMLSLDLLIMTRNAVKHSSIS